MRALMEQRSILGELSNNFNFKKEEKLSTTTTASSSSQSLIVSPSALLKNPSNNNKEEGEEEIGIANNMGKKSSNNNNNNNRNNNSKKRNSSIKKSFSPPNDGGEMATTTTTTRTLTTFITTKNNDTTENENLKQLVDLSFENFIAESSDRIVSRFETKQVALKTNYSQKLMEYKEENVQLQETVDDLMAALGEMTFVSAKQRWTMATKLILSKLKEAKARKNSERLRKRALSLEEQLRRVERHISNAAEDFDNMNMILEKERAELKRAKESEKFALEELRRKKMLLKKKEDEDMTLYSLSPSKMRVELREQVRREILEEMRRDVGARVERITSSTYSGSTSPLSPDDYVATTFDRLFDARENDVDGKNRRQAASEAARTIAKCVDELLSSAAAAGKNSSKLYKHSTTKKKSTEEATKSIKEQLARNRDNTNDPTDVLKIFALSALEKTQKWESTESIVAKKGF